MMGFGFFPFGFLLPLVFFFIVVRIASGYFRSVSRRHDLPRGYSDETFRVPDRTPRQEDHEARIFKLAYRLKGRITVSDIVVETGLGVRESERLIESMVDSTHVRMEVDERGIVTYEFPEIIGRFE